MKVLGIIPARYESSRFPGKPLADIQGKPMIRLVYEQCLKAKSLTDVVIATDDQRIFEAVISFGGKAEMTGSYHLNGTSRCAEVLNKLESAGNCYDVVINIQGDEPMIHPEQIDELSGLFIDSAVQIATQAKIETDLSLINNNNIVKVITDKDLIAKDFVRKMPAFNDEQFLKHVGIYGFRADVLNQIVSLQPTLIEEERRLEQMRWLDHGYRIKVGITAYESLSIDTPSDLAHLLEIIDHKEKL